jgi:hypothetical protein
MTSRRSALVLSAVILLSGCGGDGGVPESAAGSVFGQVFESYGEPAREVWVELEGRRDWTTIWGRYLFENVPAGEHTIVVRRDKSVCAFEAITLNPGESLSFDIRLPTLCRPD